MINIIYDTWLVVIVAAVIAIIIKSEQSLSRHFERGDRRRRGYACGLGMTVATAEGFRGRWFGTQGWARKTNIDYTIIILYCHARI